MSWSIPRLPTRDRESIIAYWQKVAEIPEDEVGAGILREMAVERLRTLGVDVSPVDDRGTDYPS